MEKGDIKMIIGQTNCDGESIHRSSGVVYENGEYEETFNKKEKL